MLKPILNTRFTAKTKFPLDAIDNINLIFA